MIPSLFGAVRLALVTIAVCCIAYPLFLWGFAQWVTPASANGHLIRNSAGKIIGSRVIAQNFTSERYFHSRPSAVGYNGTGSGGSNLSSASPELRKRAELRIAAHKATKEHPLPVDLATASGSGLEPYITLAAAEYQISRIASARGISSGKIGKMIKNHVTYPGGWIASEPIVNVLELNLNLDLLN